MRFKAEIDDYKGLKKGGMKLPFYLPDEEAKKILAHLPNFLDRQLVVTVEIDAAEEMGKAQLISPDMRKKTYAILRDMADHIGQGTESMKVEMKREFLGATGYDEFSLSDCSKRLAMDFIDFLVQYCFEYGVPLKDSPKDAYGDEIERYIRLCLDKHVCCICGKQYGDTPHHCDTIGMGSNRNKVDDSEHYVLPLCQGIGSHHEEIHKIGDREFSIKYHVKPVKRGKY